MSDGTNSGLWVLLFMYLYGGLEDHMREIEEEAAAKEAFEEYARNCPHLELENDGRATYHICRHPVRDNLSDWVMCDRTLCPFMAVNASPEERERYDHALTLESLNACRSGEHPCEGCEYLEWEADMGKHIPYCELDEEYYPEKCGEFRPSELYRTYLEMEGGTRDEGGMV